MCLFCDIVAGKIPSAKVYENDKVLCFNDINPAAPVHVLVVPKKHFDDIRVMSHSEEGRMYMGEVISAIDKVCEIKSLDSGFRVVNNCGKDGGQTVMHAHFHVLGGTKFTEKII